MNEKSKYFAQFWLNDSDLDKVYGERQEASYYVIEKVDPFTGTHPAIMNEWIKNGNYEFDPSKINQKMSLKKHIAYGLDKLLGWRLGEYRNYKTLKK